MIYNSKKACVFFCLFAFFQRISALLLLYFIFCWRFVGPKTDIGVHEQKQKEILFGLVLKYLLKL